MKFLVLGIWLLLGGSPALAEVRTVVQEDLQGSDEKVMRLTDGYTGEAEAFYADGKPRWHGFFKNGLADGIFTGFGEGAKIRNLVSRSKGVLHGVYLIFRDDGTLAQSAVFDHGQQVGLPINYLPSGETAPSVLPQTKEPPESGIKEDNNR
jgi:antitoxin component YwqK of YwqJK toxin-antitoxin module